MKTPIQYALTWPDRAQGCARTMDWKSASRLDFEPVDHERFPALRLASQVVEAGGSAGAIFNGANEAAVAAFLDRRISFGMIAELVCDALAAIEPTPLDTIEDVYRADRAARDEVSRRLEQTARRESHQSSAISHQGTEVPRHS
jgi:1-deoxy-D-xylulose-5-phosphate reductoisomerase